MRYHLASDNWAPALPAVLEAVMAANTGDEMSYGRDRYTSRLQDIVRDEFGGRATAYPVFNGTGANVVALQAMQPTWGGVICAHSAHINTDEGGAPERVAGLKMLQANSIDGKLTVDHVTALAHNFGIVHHAQPSVVSLTQSTELGTLYTPEEIAAVAEVAHGYGMGVHLDGARLTNAAAALNLPLGALATDVGVDVISLGGTKSGLMFGELVVVLEPDRVTGIEYIRKYTMQLASKMRYISAQFIALLEGELWRHGARHANEQATLLRSLVEDIPGLTITQPTQANAVFAILPPGVEDEVRAIADFQTWNPATREVRWMCSHETTDDVVYGFAKELREIVASASG